MIPPFWRWKTKIEEVRVKLDDHVFYREQAGVISKDPLFDILVLLVDRGIWNIPYERFRVAIRRILAGSIRR